MAFPAFFNSKQFAIPALQGLCMLVVFIAAVCFHGTSDPLLALFMPLLSILAWTVLYPALKGGWRLPATSVPISLGLFWLYLMASTLWSSVPYNSQMFALLITTMPMVFCMIVMARDDRRAAWTFALSFSCGWFGLGIWALLQFYVIPSTAGHRISGPMLDPNNMAALFNMGMLPAAAWFIAARDKKALCSAFAIFTVLTMSIVVTESRAGFVIACVCLSLLAVLMNRSFRQTWWKAPIYALVPVATYFLANTHNGQQLKKSFIELSYSTSASIIDRRSLWGAGLKMLWQHPLGDIGLGNFFYYYPAYRMPSDLSDGFFVHLDPLQLTLETGWIAALFLYAFLLAVLVRMIVAYRRLPPDGSARAVLCGSAAGLLSIALHSHINYNLYMPGILLPLGMLLGVWYVAGEQAPGLDRRHVVALNGSVARRVCLAGLFVFLAVTSLWPFYAGMAAYGLSQVSLRENNQDHEGAVSLLHQIERYSLPGNFSVYEVLARLAFQEANASPAGSDERLDHLRKGMAYVQKARADNPAFSVFKSLEAQFYYLGNGQLYPDGAARAEAMLREIIAQNPMDIDSREGLAMILQSHGQNHEALDILEAGLIWPRPKGVPDIQFLVAVAKARELVGDVKGRDEMIEVAKEKAQAYNMTLN